jgi:hypothetical protein
MPGAEASRLCSREAVRRGRRASTSIVKVAGAACVEVGRRPPATEGLRLLEAVPVDVVNGQVAADRLSTMSVE